MRKTRGATREAVGAAVVLLVAGLSRAGIPSFLPVLPARVLAPLGVLLSRVGPSEGDRAGGEEAGAASSWGRMLFEKVLPPPGLAPGWSRVPARVVHRDARRGILEVVLPRGGASVVPGCPAVAGECLLGLVGEVEARVARIEPLGRGRFALPARLHYVRGTRAAASAAGEGGPRSVPGPRVLLRPAGLSPGGAARTRGGDPPIAETYLDLLEDPRFLEALGPATSRIELRTIEPDYLLEGAPLLPEGLLAGDLDRGVAAPRARPRPGSARRLGSIPKPRSSPEAGDRLRCRPRISPFTPDVLCLLVPDSSEPPGDTRDDATVLDPPRHLVARLAGRAWVGPGWRSMWLILEGAVAEELPEPGDPVVADGVLAGSLLWGAQRVAFARGPEAEDLAGFAYLERGAPTPPPLPCGLVVARGRIRANGTREYRVDVGEGEGWRRIREGATSAAGAGVRISPRDRPLVPPPILGWVPPGGRIASPAGEDGGGTLRIRGPRSPFPGEAIRILTASGIEEDPSEPSPARSPGGVAASGVAASGVATGGVATSRVAAGRVAVAADR